jgi:hypothetical protein
MFASIEAKLIAAAVLLIALATAVIWFGTHERGIGAASVQAKWDATTSAQAAVAVEASEAARGTEQQQSNDFAGISAGYLQATTHAYPSIADALPAAVAAGAVQLRDTCPAAGSDSRAEAAARARRADAAVTQALADRVTHSIAAVRAGDDADKREAEFRALIVSLRATLTAERKP